jgi:hypothetical protein
MSIVPGRITPDDSDRDSGDSKHGDRSSPGVRAKTPENDHDLTSIGAYEWLH